MFEAELKIAVEAAKAAGDFLVKRINLLVDSQDGKDIKMAADKQSESIIVEKLKKTGIPILSEEAGLIANSDSDKLCWIVDPIDGTLNYSRGLGGMCCVSIALWKGGHPALGVINRFERNEIYTGVVGASAKINGATLKTSGIARIDQAVLATGFPVGRDYSSAGLADFITNIQRFKKIRMLGSAALMATFVATGAVDVYMEDGIMLWDIAAAAAIVLAAGGEFKYLPRGNNKCLCVMYATKDLAEACDVEGI